MARVAKGLPKPKWIARHPRGPDDGDLEATELLLSPSGIVSYDAGGYRVQSVAQASGQVEWVFDRRTLNLRDHGTPIVSVHDSNVLVSLQSNERSFIFMLDKAGSGRQVYAANDRGVGILLGGQVIFVGGKTFARIDPASGKVLGQVETSYRSRQDGLLSFDRYVVAMDIGQKNRDLLVIDQETGGLRARVPSEPGFASIRQSVVHGDRWLGRQLDSFVIVNLKEARIEHVSQEHKAIERIGVAGDSACWISPPKPPPHDQSHQLLIFDLKSLSVRRVVDIPIEFTYQLWVQRDQVLVGGHGIACFSLSDGSVRWAVGSSRLRVHSIAATEDFVACSANRDQIHCYSWDSLREAGGAA